MKIYTNENNTATLKLLIAANLGSKKIELHQATFEGSTYICKPIINAAF